MLSREQNEALTRVGPGTPMGELLRRYWYPVAFVRDLDEWPVKKVRLLGEDFALWRTPQGGYGIVQEKCPHRSASLVYGVVENDGLRCGYHGWMFDFSGRCVDQPAEPEKSAFKDRIRAQSGSAEAMGGMVWAYIGPDPVPQLPRYDVYVMDGVRDLGHALLPCSWLQIMENAVDPHHVEWLHGRYFQFLGEQSGFAAPPSFQNRHVKVGFDVFDHGIIKRRLLEGESEESDDWKVGHPLVFPFCMRVGGGGIDQMQIRVPIDDTTTWFILYTVHHPPGLVEYPEQVTIPDYEVEWRDANGRHIVDYVEGQDIMAWVTQGAVADRTAEHIGKSDIGLVMLRRMFRENVARVEAGEDPIAVVRRAHDEIELPCEKDKFGAGADFALQWIDMGFTRYSPQLDALRKLHLDAARARGEEVGAAP
ncbi:MAG: Rieske 2Fe-2S domain-containing protein [Acidimicrobiales bacterium]